MNVGGNFMGMRPRWFAFATAAVVQICLLAWMVVDRAIILAKGVEIVMDAKPVDPRDFLRGDYVVLRYDISELDQGKLSAGGGSDWPGDGDVAARQRVWVKLSRGEDGAITPISVHRSPPPTDAGELLIAARVVGCRWNARQGARDCSTLHLVYGIESYFVPEGEGRMLEAARDKKRMAVVAAVMPDGRAAIKRLLVDGNPIYAEPMF